MMATHRTPADGEALGPAIRILVKRVMADPALSASSRAVMIWLLLEGRRTELSADDLPSFREHIRMLEVIRERALAKGREKPSPPSTRSAKPWTTTAPEDAERTKMSAPLPFSSREKGSGQSWTNQVPNRPRRVARGTKLARIGSNWLELADFGCPKDERHPEKLIPISDLSEMPTFPAEKSRLGGRERPAERPFWLNGVSAAALASGQNCPPGA